MARSSSNRKVARAAGIGGGRTSRGRVPWSYYGVIALVVVLGLVGTFVSRNHRLAQINKQGNSAPTVGTVWNEAIAFYQCGKFAPNVPKPKSNPYGLTTSGDGIIHIDPTTKSAAGKNATLGKWASANGVKLTAAELQLPGGRAYQAGDSCQGGKGQVYVKQFAYAGDPIGVLLKGDPRAVHLQDQLELVVAFVPPSGSSRIPPPPAAIANKLKSLAATSPASTTTTTSPGPAATSTTVAPPTGPTTATTVAGSATTTTPATTPTTVKSSATTPTTARSSAPTTARPASTPTTAKAPAGG